MLRFLVRLRRWENWAKAAGFITLFVSLIVCSFLWAISNPPSPSSRPVAQHNHAAPNAEQQSASTDPRGTKAVPLAVEIIPPKEGTPEAERNEEERQQKAANERGLVVGTWVLTLATALLFAVAAIQAAFFWVQLQFMREGMRDATIAANAAKESADTAKTQAEIARDALEASQDTAKRQLRAYVHVADVEVNHGNDEWQPNIRIMIKNYGQTPARRVNHKVGTELPIIGPGLFKLKEEPHFSDLGPTQEITKSIMVSHGFWHKTVRPSVASKAVKYYVFGEITYSDIFSSSVRTTEYRLQLDIDDAGDCGLSFCEEGNRSD
jgi:hypothetical protein